VNGEGKRNMELMLVCSSSSWTSSRSLNQTEKWRRGWPGGWGKSDAPVPMHPLELKKRKLLGSTAAARAHNHGSWSLVWARLEEEERNLATQKCSEWAAGVHSWINLGLPKWLGRSMCGGEWQRATGIWGKNELHQGNKLTGTGHCDGVWWLACR
jgi:hypothetical protein